MIWLSGILIVMAAIFTYVFIAPLYLEINSLTGVCRLRFHHAAAVALKLDKSSLILDLKVFWWKKQIDLFAEKDSRQKKLTSRSKKRRRWKPPFRKIRSVIASFKVNQCNI